MFRRISGSSSMTSIFFMGSKNRESNGDGGACTEGALEMDPAAVKFGAAFDQEQAQAGAGSRPDIAAAVKRFEQAILIFLWNADAMIANHADCFGSI